jgi:class 3 adenylate cyclase
MTIQEWLRADTEHVMLAILFTDIVGSTALQRELGDQAYNAVRRAHFAQAHCFIAAFHGYEVKRALFTCIRSTAFRASREITDSTWPHVTDLRELRQRYSSGRGHQTQKP